ncbi:MAG TPA: hypothetical protein VEF76_07845 [Patescibacteria group bacterium]|nr:hypothetical protein [Patescibacteria group bacterium]
MKRSMIALSLLAVLSVTACHNTGTWTPQSGGRTAGAGQVEVTKADTAVHTSMQK